MIVKNWGTELSRIRSVPYKNYRIGEASDDYGRWCCWTSWHGGAVTGVVWASASGGSGTLVGGLWPEEDKKFQVRCLEFEEDLKDF